MNNFRTCNRCRVLTICKVLGILCRTRFCINTLLRFSRACYKWWAAQIERDRETEGKETARELNNFWVSRTGNCSGLFLISQTTALSWWLSFRTCCCCCDCCCSGCCLCCRWPHAWDGISSSSTPPKHTCFPDFWVMHTCRDNLLVGWLCLHYVCANVYVCVCMCVVC